MKKYLKNLILYPCIYLAFTQLSFAGLFDDKEARQAIIDLQNQFAAYKNEQTQKYNGIQSAIIALQGQIEGLQNQKSQTTGQIEVINDNLAKLKNSYEVLANTYADKSQAQDKTIEEIKQQLSGAMPASNSSALTGNEAAPIYNSNQGSANNSLQQKRADPLMQNSNSNKQNFNQALDYFSKGDFSKSADKFNALLSTNTDNELSPLIVYYLGNSYYAVQKYKQAKSQLLSFINNYPSHNKIPDVYLTLSSVYLESNDKVNAKKTLDYILKYYSKHNVANLAKKYLANLQN